MTQYSTVRTVGAGATSTAIRALPTQHGLGNWGSKHDEKKHEFHSKVSPSNPSTPLRKAGNMFHTLPKIRYCEVSYCFRALANVTNRKSVN